ncbi:MAG: site-2 protease family protein [Sedimentisphaerales bacterium]|nr:site-2 protease family protein [Sedimentisphaerales bacterium]
MEYAALGVVWYIVFIVSTTFHEACHGFAAVKLGDPTACHHGLVTLDPMPHIRRSPFGMVVIPIVSFLLSGWMIGWASAPFDPYWALSNRKRAAWMALAGPGANLTLVLAAALIIRGGMLFGFFHPPETVTFTLVTEGGALGWANSAAIVVSIVFSLNLLLLVFNLIPLPPLDGSNVLLLFLSDEAAERYETFLHQPAYGMIGLVIAWQIFGPVFGLIHILAINLLYPGAGYH